MASATNLFSSTWSAVWEQVRGRRQSNTAQKSLEHELAAYTTESDLKDLEAILDRHSDADTAGIRRILVGRRG